MRVLVLLIVLLSARRTLLAQVSAGIEVQSSTWEKGIAEVTLRSTFPVQSSGITGETIVKGRCEALIQKVTMASGKTADVMQNSVRVSDSIFDRLPKSTRSILSQKE